MSTSFGDSKNLNYKTINTKVHFFEKITINNIIKHRNNSNQKIFEGITKEKSPNQTNNKKVRISPYKNHFNKSSLSNTLLNMPNNNLKKSKKYYIKSPLSIFKNSNNNNPTSSQMVDINKNIPLIPININQNKNNHIQNIKPSNNNINNQGNVEYNTINCIINNFNLSYKNLDSKEDKKTNSMGKIKKFHDYDIFNKNNNKIKNQLENLTKNNSLINNTNNIKNISNLSEINNSNINTNINNLTNLQEESKIDEIIQENKQKQIKIQQKNQENSKKLILLKELERKNKKLKNEYQEIKIKNMEYSKSLERLFKFLRVLKNSGLEINEMMENISSGEDYDEFDDDSELEEGEETDTKKSKKNKNKKSESEMTEGSVPISNIRQLSSGLLSNNEKFCKGSQLKINYNKNKIPILNFEKIKKHK